MNAQNLLLSLALAFAGIAGCAPMLPAEGASQKETNVRVNTLKGFFTESPSRLDKLRLSDEEWKKKLTPEQYRILRKHGTEAAFCGVFHDNKKTGVYFCAGCDLPLFASDAKFDSGTGWPSFFQPVKKENVWLRSDRSYGMVRDEVLCSRCDGHLGHVFDDAPGTATGLRFCMNSEAMTFKEGQPDKLLAGKGE